MRTVAWGLSRLVVRYDRSLKMYRSFSHIAFFMIVLLRVMQKLVVIPRNTGLRSSALGFGLECFGEFFDFFGFLDHTKGKNVLSHESWFFGPRRAGRRSIGRGARRLRGIPSRLSGGWLVSRRWLPV